MKMMESDVISRLVELLGHADESIRTKAAEGVIASVVSSKLVYPRGMQLLTL